MLMLFCVWLALILCGLLAGGLSIIGSLDAAFSAVFGAEWGDVVMIVALGVGLVLVPMWAIERVVRSQMRPAARAEFDEVKRETRRNSSTSDWLIAFGLMLAMLGVALLAGWVK